MNQGTVWFIREREMWIYIRGIEPRRQILILRMGEIGRNTTYF